VKLLEVIVNFRSNCSVADYIISEASSGCNTKSIGYLILMPGQVFDKDAAHFVCLVIEDVWGSVHAFGLAQY
jgi:hypothetical protein